MAAAVTDTPLIAPRTDAATTAVRQPAVSVVIATRNRREHLRHCLASVEAQRWPRLQVVVVDDASDDGTAEMVAQEFPSAEVVRVSERGGVGGAQALGLEHATGDIVICLDDDARLISDDVCERVAERFAVSDDLGAVCFRVEAPDGTVRRREIPRRDKRLPMADEEIAYFLGGATAYRARALREVGGFASDITFGSVELDLAFRLFSAGFRTLFTQSVRVVHDNVPSPSNSLHREENYVRNRIRIAARYLPGPQAHVHAALWTALCITQAIIRGHTRQTLRGVREGLAQWPTLRAEERRLGREQMRRLEALSGRTWY